MKNLAPGRSKASLGADALHYLDSILVSVGWNKNDDVFDSVEVWAARHSPGDKPFNFEHHGADIVDRLRRRLGI